MVRYYRMIAKEARQRGGDGEVATARLAVHSWIYAVLAVKYGIVIVQVLKIV
jgi:hypothetical protein